MDKYDGLGMLVGKMEHKVRIVKSLSEQSRPWFPNLSTAAFSGLSLDSGSGGNPVPIVGCLATPLAHLMPGALPAPSCDNQKHL